MKSNKKESYIFSKVSISGRALSSLEEIKISLLDHPGVSLMYSGEILRYSIKTQDFTDRYFILEISKSNISITIYSATSPVFFLKEAILKLLLILSFIKAYYSIELSEFYPFIMEILSKDTFSTTEFKKLVENTKATYGDDVVLSRRIITLLNENKKLSNEILFLRSISLRLMTSALLLKYSGKINFKSASKDFGIDEVIFKKLLEETKSLGFTTLWHNKSEFTLVKT